jgi:glycolate oxidase
VEKHFLLTKAGPMTVPLASDALRHHDALGELVAALPPFTVITDRAGMEKYRFDRSNDSRVGVPLAVVLPTSTEEVQTVVRFAATHGIPVIPRGAGSGLSGGATPVDGSIVLSTQSMRHIDVDPVTRIAVAQPGAFNAEVKAAAAAHGLWYPPDPASFEFCSIGGNVATNAGGLCCVKYGVTTDYVLGMTVVLADGTAVKLGGPRLKDVAGLSLTKLFVGSEGTLGIITEVVLKLIPPQRRAATLVASFARLDDATQAVLDITRRMRPSMLEFMDRPTINAVEDVTPLGLNRSTEAMLIVQSDEPAEYAAAEMAAVAEICSANDATEVYSTVDPDVGETFVTARRMAIPSMEQTGTLLLGDVGVPLPQLGALVGGIAQISATHGLPIAVIAHAGDGNTHPLLVFDGSKPDERARAEVAYGEVMDLAISLGGTITGEHGVGRTKKAWLPGYVGEDVMELNRRIKTALDPAGILNPGSIF